MVARRWGTCPFIDEPRCPGDPQRATIKALPSALPPLSPLRMLMSFSKVDANWSPVVVCTFGVGELSIQEISRQSCQTQNNQDVYLTTQR